MSSDKTKEKIRKIRILRILARSVDSILAPSFNLRFLREARMFDPDDVSIEITSVDQDVMLVEIHTPVGTMSILGNVTLIARVLYVRRAHVDGLMPGSLGRRGLNAIGRKLLEEADADEILVEGGTRTTGRCKGRAPRTIRFPHP
ncbi:hypothetical protein ACQR16_00820 [Bradyrhizobium oligotrophicum]|uniref:hypothetical protein n=1 Tax=Bradyrhizobium oligotrophicum TaxID=44255 RepID=UPI003EBDE827